ncbi:MAG: hypothetical protein KF819_35085 [Labilithrix sp.]|nr:hypothetical protein [Labilithrix sp.]
MRASLARGLLGVALTLATTSARAEPPAPAPAPAARPAGRAEPSAGDLATARNALREGLALRDKGDLAGALARFNTAYDLVQTPVTGFELGKAHMLLGHVLQAHELFKRVVRMPPAMEESQRSAAAREEAERLSADLEPRIPSLQIHVKLPPEATCAVQIDDEPIALAGPTTPRAVEPGKHVIVAKAGDGPEERVSIEIGEGETKEVHLAPQWIKPAAPALPPGSQIVYLRQTNPLVFVGFGIASVGLLLTIVSGVTAVNEASSAKSLCGEEYCSRDVREGEIKVAHRWGIATIVSGAVTIGFTALGIYGARTPINEKVVTGVRPYIGGTTMGLEGRF